MFMPVPFDPLGNVVLSLQVVILFLLILGLPFVKGRDSKRNVARHGYLTAAAVVLHGVLIFVVMVPSFRNGFGGISRLSFLESFDVWSHIALGTLAEVLGIVLVGSWVLKGPSKMMCARNRKWMMPVFVVWAVSLVNGAVVHILGLM